MNVTRLLIEKRMNYYLAIMRDMHSGIIASRNPPRLDTARIWSVEYHRVQALAIGYASR